MFPRTEENLTAQQGTKLVRRDVKARCFRMSSITCYAVGESGEGMEGKREGSQHVIGPFPSTTKLLPENEANLLRLMKRKVSCRCADESKVEHNLCYS